MEARTTFRGTVVSKRGFGVALMALIVVISALLAISFAGAGSAKPSAHPGTVVTQPVGGYVGPANDHGALP